MIMTPQTKKAFYALYGRFAYQEAGGGRILITDDWLAKNLIQVNLALVGKHTVHKVIANDVADIFAEIAKLKLPKTNPAYTGPVHWDGCFVPRHKMWNPARNLSIHSWGCAIDLNASENPPATVGKMSPQIVDIFQKHGWTWGGSFRGANRDPMHFQACAPLAEI